MNSSVEASQTYIQNSDYIISINNTQVYAENAVTGLITHSNSDATRTIQETLTDLSSGGIIHIKNGIYVIRSTILLPSDIIIEGEGRNTVVKLDDLANVNMFEAKSSTAKNITIRNFQLDGNKEHQTLSYPKYNLMGIQLQGATNSTIENIYIKNTTGFGMAVVTNSERVESHLIIKNVMINDTGGDGIYFRSNMGIIDNANINNYGDTGIVISNCKNCVLNNSVITGNKKSDSYDGINISRSSENISIINNKVINSSRDGIHFVTLQPELFSGHNVLINNNLITSSVNNGIFLQSGSQNVTISNNFIINNGGSGVVSTGENINVIYNVIGENMKHGISVFNSIQTEIINNLIYDNGKQMEKKFDGINIDGNLTNNIHISDNYIYDVPPSQRFGIYTYLGTNIHAERNIIDNDNNRTQIIPNTDPKTDQFVSTNGNKFTKPAGSGDIEIQLNGKVSDYTSGTNLHLLIIEPDKTVENESIPATREGHFNAIILLTSSAQTGKYHVISKYFNSIIGESFFTVIDNENKLDEKVIPEWMKNSAHSWLNGYISDSDFDSIMEYIVKGKIITHTSETNVFPFWIKNITSWWTNNLISTEDFLHCIEYLYIHNII